MMLNVSTEVISVNIFRRGADIVRRGQAEIHAGKQVLLFSGIPETADADTLRIFGAEGMTCSNFRVRNSGEDAEESPEIKELQTRIRELRELQEVKKLQADLWKTNGDFTGRVQASPAEVEEYIAKLPERIGTLQAEIARAEKETAELEKKRAELMEKAELPAVTADVTSDRAGTFTFEVRYHDTAASWEPVYEIHSDGEGPVEFILRARMCENTGEDWNGINLSLFTGTPSAGGVMPNVTPLFLDIRENVMANRHFMPNPMMGMAMAAKAAGAAPMEARVLADSAPVRLEAEEAEEKSDGTMTEYAIPDKKDIPGNGEAAFADLKTWSVPAEYHIMTAPELHPGVFLVAEIAAGDYPFTDTQQIEIYLKDRYSGSYHLTPDFSGEKDTFTLGRDERVQVSRKEILKKTSETFLKGQKVTEFRYETTLANVSGQDLTVTMKDQIPVSRSKDIAVTALDTGDASREEETGILTRRIALSPGERKTVTTAWKTAWPKDKKIQEIREAVLPESRGGRICPECGARTEGKFCTTCGCRLP